MLVIDASAAVDVLLGTARAPALRTVLAGEHDLHAPALVDLELVSVVRRWLRDEALTLEQADRAVDELGQLALVRHAHAPLRERIWALRDRCSPYDACYLALAESLDARLLTTDRRLATAAAGLVDVIDLGA